MSKKTLISIGLILAALVLFLTGCEEGISRLPEDGEPTNWDIKTDLRWKEVATGTIKEKILKRYGYCDRSPKCKKDCLKHGTYFNILFENGETYSVGQVKRYRIVVAGQYGTLYKYDIGSPDSDSWFQWVLKRFPQEKKSISEVKISQPTIYSEKITEKPKKSWKNAKIVLPKAHEPVIVKFKSGIITIAYVNQKEDWKLTSNREKTSGGSSIYNVAEWQEFNLE